MKSAGAGIRLEAGVLVGGRFTLRRPVGEGGMGWVWEAVEDATNKPVALKILKSAREDDRRRFLREVRAAAAVSHPNVVVIHEVLELEDDSLIMVMELLDGVTLGAVLEREGRLELSSAAAVLLGVVAALEAAHAAGIVHRDLKPDNIFLCRSAAEGAPLGVKVLDFGVAKLTASEGLAARTEALTGTGSMIGTPYYMSPEQIESEKDLDARADIWSFGVVLYECLAGCRPTEGDTVGRVLKRILMADFPPIASRCEGLPDEIQALVGKMLTGARTERLASLSEIADVLRRHAAPSIPMLLPSTRIATDEALAQTVRATTPGPLDLRAETTGRSDTHAAVAIVSPSVRARVRTRVMVAGLAVALAGLGTWRIGFAPKTVPPALASGQPSATTVNVTPPPSASPSTSAVPSAPASASPSTSAVPSASPSTSASTSTSMRAGGPRCETNEVPSKGHCCARGLEWQGKQCERPLATKF